LPAVLCGSGQVPRRSPSIQSHRIPLKIANTEPVKNAAVQECAAASAATSGVPMNAAQIAAGVDDTEGRHAVAACDGDRGGCKRSLGQLDRCEGQ
jgi:hypothetical protein